MKQKAEVTQTQSLLETPAQISLPYRDLNHYERISGQTKQKCSHDFQYCHRSFCLDTFGNSNYSPCSFSRKPSMDGFHSDILMVISPSYCYHPMVRSKRAFSKLFPQLCTREAIYSVNILRSPKDQWFQVSDLSLPTLCAQVTKPYWNHRYVAGFASRKKWVQALGGCRDHHIDLLHSLHEQGWGDDLENIIYHSFHQIRKICLCKTTNFKELHMHF